MAVFCGHVYCLYLPVAVKEKLLVPAYVTPDDRVRFFVINSERTDFQKSKPEIAKHVIQLSQDANQLFLKHDSWLSCHEVIGGWTTADIDATLKAYRGPLDKATQILVKTIMMESRLFSEREKNLFVSQWPL